MVTTSSSVSIGNIFDSFLSFLEYFPLIVMFLLRSVSHLFISIEWSVVSQSHFWFLVIVVPSHYFLNFQPKLHVFEIDGGFRVFLDQNTIDVFLEIKLKVFRVLGVEVSLREVLDLKRRRKVFTFDFLFSYFHY